MNTVELFTTPASKGYALIDSGSGEKLERFGDVLLARPDPQALWSKKLSTKRWQEANAHFLHTDGKGTWNIKEGTPESWVIEIGGLKMKILPTPFKHVGIFPEQVSNWTWIKDQVEKATSTIQGSKKIQILNLFGYTGGATLAAAKAGAEVCHVDGSKASVTWARENAVLNTLEAKPIRWIVDDVLAFVKREVKRGVRYDAIIMDPPAFGRGPEGQVWKIEDDFLKLIELCKELLSAAPLFMLINGYASGYSPLAYKNILSDLASGHTSQIHVGELALEEEGSGRLLPAGIFARLEF